MKLFEKQRFTMSASLSRSLRLPLVAEGLPQVKRFSGTRTAEQRIKPTNAIVRQKTPIALTEQPYEVNLRLTGFLQFEYLKLF